MKSNKGITLTSLIIYVVAMTIVVTTISTLSTYFYSNMSNIDAGTDGAMAYTAFNMYFSQEINTKNNYVISSEGKNNYIVFSKTGNQYTFKNNAIYRNQVKICNGIENCTFEVLKSNETKEKNDLIKVYIKTTGSLEYTNIFKIQNF